MSGSNRALWYCIVATGIVLLGLSALAALNWDVVSGNLAEAFGTRAAKTRAALFRLGEVASLGAELRERYGTESDVSYDTATGDRVLRISFGDGPVPVPRADRQHAREVAAFAVSKTKKFEQIDIVEVRFVDSQDERGRVPVDASAPPETFRFTLPELRPLEPRPESEDRDPSAAHRDASAPGRKPFFATA